MENKILMVAESGCGQGHLVRTGALAVALEQLGCRVATEILDLHGSPLFPERLLRASACVVDAYHLDEEWYHRAAALTPLVVLDDTARVPYGARLLHNASPGARRLAYTPSHASQLLLGSSYALLRCELGGAKEHHSPRMRRALIALGGGTTRERLQEAVSALFSLGVEEVHAVVSPEISLDFTPLALTRYSGLDAQALGNLMRSMDVAVCGGGQVLLELAALGIPAVALLVARNQQSQLDGFLELGVIGGRIDCSENLWQERLTEELGRISSLEERRRRGARGREAVPLDGAHKTACVLMRMLREGGLQTV